MNRETDIQTIAVLSQSGRGEASRIVSVLQKEAEQRGVSECFVGVNELYGYLFAEIKSLLAKGANPEKSLSFVLSQWRTIAEFQRRHGRPLSSTIYHPG